MTTWRCDDDRECNNVGLISQLRQQLEGSITNHNEHGVEWAKLMALKKDDPIGRAFALIEESVLHHLIERDGWTPDDTCYMETTQVARKLIEEQLEAAESEAKDWEAQADFEKEAKTLYAQRLQAAERARDILRIGFSALIVRNQDKAETALAASREEVARLRAKATLADEVKQAVMDNLVGGGWLSHWLTRYYAAAYLR